MMKKMAQKCCSSKYCKYFILFYSTGQGCEQSGQECGKWCVDCTNSKPCKLNPGQIPYCPANGASGEGCVRKFV